MILADAFFASVEMFVWFFFYWKYLKYIDFFEV